MCTQSEGIFLGAGSPWSLLVSLRRNLCNPHLESISKNWFHGLCSKGQICKGVEMFNHAWKHVLLALSLQKPNQTKILAKLTAIFFWWQHCVPAKGFASLNVWTFWAVKHHFTFQIFYHRHESKDVCCQIVSISATAYWTLPTLDSGISPQFISSWEKSTSIKFSAKE